MLLGCIADDLTGATDLGVTLAREGLSVIQVNGVPEATLQLPAADAVVVALKSRTNPAAEAVAWSLASLEWLRGRGARRIYFKYCSTFDSTPQGNIGPVADALLDALGERCTVATPAYPRNGRTVYKGNLFVGDVPLAESGMKDHPLTPMRDSSLVRVLGAQTRRKVALVPCEVMEAGAAAIREKLAGLEGYAVLDSVRDEHLVAAGEACLGMKLTTGGAGLAMGLARALRQKKASALGLRRLDGPAVILAGSCSQATLAQIEAYRGPSYRIHPEKIDPDAALSWALPQLATAPLIYASAPASGIVAGCGEAIEAAFRAIAQGLASQGVRKFVVAGGETSGAVVEALGVRALAIGPEIDPGVPWTAAVGGEPYLLALKSGNFGSREFFAKALGMLPLTETQLREALVMHGQSLYQRGYAHGSSGNLSARLADGLLITPTNSCLGRLDPARISKVDLAGHPVSGDSPSKEAFLHLAMYQERPSAQGIVHLHCTHCVAVSCLEGFDGLPPITAYYVMRIRQLALVPYYRPGDRALAEAVREKAKNHHAILLANHGPVVAGKSLEDAVYNAEELEETAKLHLLLEGRRARLLDPAQIADLDKHFPS